MSDSLGTVMSLDEVEDALSNGKQKGVYDVAIRNAIDTPVLAVDFLAIPQLKGKDAQSTANSVNINLKKIKADFDSKGLDFPELVCKITKDKTKVMLINLDVYNTLKNDETADEPTETQ